MTKIVHSINGTGISEFPSWLKKKKKKGLNYVSFINQVEKEGLSGASMDNEPIPDHSL